MHILNKIRHTMIFIMVLASLAGCNRFRSDNLDRDEVSSAIKVAIDSMDAKKYFVDHDVREHLYEEFLEFYKERDYRLAWISGRGTLSQAEELMNALQNAHHEGLDSSSYRFSRLRKLQEELFTREARKEESQERINQLVMLDFYMTSSYLTYASHLLAGRIDPARLDGGWEAYPRELNLSSHLEQAISNKSIEESLLDLNPDNIQYKGLRKHLARYKELAAHGGWPSVPGGATLEKGSKGERVLALRKMLGITGDLDTTQNQSPRPELYDDVLVEAVNRFQARNGWTPDGKVGPQTLALLNIPVEKRIEQIELNMERLRWMPLDGDGSYVLVNVPAYDLKVFEDGKKEMEMKIIVGKEYSSTPIFKDTMEFIVFSPDWTVPLSIAKEEILPILQRNPDYLRKENMVVFASWDVSDSTTIDPAREKWNRMTAEDFNYRIVQLPGDKNPLGHVKFIFPNDKHIYLHDTPSEWLFERDKRGYSHGCIRVEKPVELANVLLERAKGKWNPEKIKEAMNQSKPDTVYLEQKMPVKITYQTAFVDDNEVLHFREDIYEHDRKQYSAIERKEKKLENS
jgi:L,D-transpeptidase YcbB